MAENSSTNPHVRDNYSPLSTLAMQAIRRFGDFNPGTIDGDVMLMFLEFANLIIDDVRMHPYHQGELDYYISPDDVREIPDQVIVNGLLYHYAMQQGSEKLQLYMPMYHRSLNQQLWYKLNGNTPIRMRIVDDGTNPANSNGAQTDPNNGTVSYD